MISNRSGISIKGMIQSREENKPVLTQVLYNRPINQLINDYLEEVVLKNHAYHFIIQEGLLEEYTKYCDKCVTKECSKCLFKEE